jgi:hypothetical protein
MPQWSSSTNWTNWTNWTIAPPTAGSEAIPSRGAVATRHASRRHGSCFKAMQVRREPSACQGDTRGWLPRSIPQRNEIERNTMSKQQQTNNAGATQGKPSGVEGEGSYTGTQSYNERLKKHIQNEDTEELGEQAKRALEGDERAELEDAERRAKRGPAPASSEPSQR